MWRKFQTYSSGEELFGLPVTDYTQLDKIRKELNLLQKLYGLYNTVMDNVDSYYDILWTEVDTEKINTELLDFQNRWKGSVCWCSETSPLIFDIMHHRALTIIEPTFF